MLPTIVRLLALHRRARLAHRSSQRFHEEQKDLKHPRPFLLRLCLNSNKSIELFLCTSDLAFEFRRIVARMSCLKVQSTKKDDTPGVLGEFVVCHCHGVTEGDVRRAISETGASSVEEVSMCTRAGTGCRACQCKLNRILSGLPADCGRFGLCQHCGYAAVLCNCSAA